MAEFREMVDDVLRASDDLSTTVLRSNILGKECFVICNSVVLNNDERKHLTEEYNRRKTYECRFVKFSELRHKKTAPQYSKLDRFIYEQMSMRGAEPNDEYFVVLKARY